MIFQPIRLQRELNLVKDLLLLHDDDDDDDDSLSMQKGQTFYLYLRLIFAYGKLYMLMAVRL